MEKLFLVTHSATISKIEEEKEDVSTVHLTFYSMVKAKDTEAASDQVVQYRDRGFTTRIENISEVGDNITSEELFDLLEHKKVLVEMMH